MAKAKQLKITLRTQLADILDVAVFSSATERKTSTSIYLVTCEMFLKVHISDVNGFDCHAYF